MLPFDKKMNLPLTDALMQFNASGRFSWHMPGHRNGRQWPELFRENLYLLDATELHQTDDLLNPVGPAGKSLEMAARFCGAGWTRYITCGSTCGILALLAACPGHGGRILVSRASHQSVLHAAMLLDLQIGWIEASLWPELYSDDSVPQPLLPQVGVADFRRAVASFGSYDAVFLTSPDYYGSCAQIKEIADEAHAVGAVVLVDEAHGAHLSLGSEFLPASAMRQNADACVQSAHKTLPALTPASLLHVSESAIANGRIDPGNVNAMLKIFHTSSPSFLIAASIEVSLDWLKNSGHGFIKQQILNIEWLGQNLAGLVQVTGTAVTKPNCADRDPLRIMMTMPDAISAADINLKLQGQNIDVEMSDLRRLILIPAIDQTRQEYLLLAEALRSIIDGLPEHVLYSTAKNEGKSSIAETEASWRQMMCRKPNMILQASQLMPGLMKTEQIDVSQSVGRVSARAVVPYPPGIPLLWPGEHIDAEMLALITALRQNGVGLTGIEHEMVTVLV